MSKINIVKKASMKILVGDVKAQRLFETVKNSAGKDIIVYTDGAQVDLARIVGIARGTKTGESQYGPWTALTGEFIAEALVGPKVGQRFRSGTLFLPDVALDLVTPVLAGLEKGAGMEIGFTVGIINDETSQNAYNYTAEFLAEPAENDPLSNLAAKLLPAPEANVAGDNTPPPNGDGTNNETGNQSGDENKDGDDPAVKTGKGGGK